MRYGIRWDGGRWPWILHAAAGVALAAPALGTSSATRGDGAAERRPGAGAASAAEGAECTGG